MLTILLESFLLEVAQNGLNADKEINYLFETLNNNFLTDLQKEIKSASMDIQEFKILAFNIINDEEFSDELFALNVKIENDNKKVNTLETAYNEVIDTLQANDTNATYNEILEDHNGNYSTSIHELMNCLDEIMQNEVEYKSNEYNFYNDLYTKLWEVL